MTTHVLFDNGSHKNVLIDVSDDRTLAVQANQHMIIDSGNGFLLDPGGHKAYNKVLAQVSTLLGDEGKLRYLFLSHQDPDIVAACNGWLLTTDATAYITGLWTRFVPHFGLDSLVQHRLLPIPDEGMVLKMNQANFVILPAHFLHSEGNFQVYDPIAKILYSGDLGASLGMPYFEVRDFDAHLRFMEGFHRRYMTARSVMKAWAEMVRPLDIDIIAPQHGAYFKGREMCRRFIDWCADLDCGIDIILNLFRIPA